MSPLLNLLADKDGFVRRRAAEALTRFHSPAAAPMLIERLGDSNRLVRYVAMTALAHYPTAEWFDLAAAKSNPQIRLRALVAGLASRAPPVDETVNRVVQSLLEEKNLQGGTSSASFLNHSSRGADQAEKPGARWNLLLPPGENRLDLLRVLALFQTSLENNAEMNHKISEHLLRTFPDADRDIRWEQIRLLGEYRFPQAFSKLLALLESERDEVAQIHIAQALAKLPSGWSRGEEERLLRWMLGTQRGWFAQFDGKGVEFPLFLQTVLADFGKQHRPILLGQPDGIDLDSLLGSVVIELIAGSPNPLERLLGLYGSTDKPEVKVKIVAALKNAQSRNGSAFLREEFRRVSEPKLRAAILQTLAAQPAEPANLPLLVEGLRLPDAEAVKVCAHAVIQGRPALDEPLANVLLSQLAERRSLFDAMDEALVALSGAQRPGRLDLHVEVHKRRGGRVACTVAHQIWQRCTGGRIDDGRRKSNVAHRQRDAAPERAEVRGAAAELQDPDRDLGLRAGRPQPAGRRRHHGRRQTNPRKINCRGGALSPPAMK